MCGIFGYSVGQAGYPGAEVLGRMAVMQSHRGPDGQGFVQAGNSGVGMLRLRMRADADEAEPVDMGKGIFAAYNGEIYRDRNGNVPTGGYGEVRVLLDTAAGDAVDGMYAAALFDASSGALTLTRDAFGIKPLYVMRAGHEALFASEVGAILPLLPYAAIRPSAIHQFLAVGRPLDSGWFVNGITTMRPGSSLRLAGGDCQDEAPLWTPERLLDGRNRTSPSPAVLRSAIGSAVERALLSHYPVGVAVSGGLDSSIVCAEIAVRGVEDVTLISIRAEGSDDGLSDIEYLGLPGESWRKWSLVERLIGPHDYFDAARRAVAVMGTPTRMSSSALYVALADAAADNGVQTLLVGEGADELFCGYDSHRAFHAGGSLADHILRPQLRRLLGDLLEAEHLVELDDAIADYAASLPGKSDWDRLRMSDFRLILEPLLMRTDHALMSRTVEGRTPFLHGDVPALAFRYSEAEHLAGGQTKHTLRQAYSGLVSPAVLTGRKTHFRAPIAAWFAGPLFGRIAAELAGSAAFLSQCGIDPNRTASLLDRTKEGCSDAADLIFRLLNLVWWAEWLHTRCPVRLG